MLQNRSRVRLIFLTPKVSSNMVRPPFLAPKVPSNRVRPTFLVPKAPSNRARPIFLAPKVPSKRQRPIFLTLKVPSKMVWPISIAPKVPSNICLVGWSSVKQKKIIFSTIWYTQCHKKNRRRGRGGFRKVINTKIPKIRDCKLLENHLINQF